MQTPTTRHWQYFGHAPANSFTDPAAAMPLSVHLLIRITVVGVLCWLSVSAALVWQLQRQGQVTVEMQADRLKILTEQQLQRQLIAIDAGSRTPDLARVVVSFGRPVCLRYKGYDVSDTVSWGCEEHPDGGMAPHWLTQWLTNSGTLPRQVQRTVTLWSVRDGTLIVEPLPPGVIDDLWRRLIDLTGLTAATIIAVNVGVWFTLRRLLRPTHEVLQALDRLADGDLETLPKDSGPREFRRIALRIDRLRQSLAQLTAQRSALTARLIDSQESERQDLARDLHDEMGQGLAALQAVSGGIRMSAQAMEPARAEDTEALDDTIEQLHAGLRVLLGRLRPPLLDSQGLAFALRELVQAWNARQRVAVGTGTDKVPLTALLELPIQDGSTAALPEAVSLALYRTAQEALTNAARYARPTGPVAVQLAFERNQDLTLRVTNNCDPIPLTSRGSGLGLAMLTERMHSLGGSLVARQVAPYVFELLARWPRTTADTRPHP